MDWQAKGRSRWSFAWDRPCQPTYARELYVHPVASRSYIGWPGEQEEKEREREGGRERERVELRGRDGGALVEDTRMRRGGGSGSRGYGRWAVESEAVGVDGGGWRREWPRAPGSTVALCSLFLSLSFSSSSFHPFPPSILSLFLSLSRYSLVIDRTLMRFVIGVCTDCTPSYERTLPPEHTYTPWFCTRASSTCLEEDFGPRWYLWSDMGQR